jgi:hypothetical protein
MTLAQIDYYFPFAVFLYGFLLVLVIEHPFFARLGEQRLGAAWNTLLQRKSLAWISFFGGGLWALQNVLLTP